MFRQGTMEDYSRITRSAMQYSLKRKPVYPAELNLQ